MGLLNVATLLSLCVATCLATYGPNHNNKDGPGSNGHGSEPRKIHVDEPKIHLNSPKIFLDKPRIHINEGGHSSLLDHESIILENDKSLYLKKALHGISSGIDAGPIVLNSGYGAGKVLDLDGGDHGVLEGAHGVFGGSHGILGGAHGVFGGSHGVLGGSHGVLGGAHGVGSIHSVGVLAHAPVVHQQPILIRRPVVVARGLTATQDHLEKLHFNRLRLGHGLYGLGHGHAGLHSYAAIPISSALHEKSVILNGDGVGHGLGLAGLGHGIAGLGHGVSGLGHGLVGFPAYNLPLIVDQPQAVVGHSNIAYVSGKDAAVGGGHKKY